MGDVSVTNECVFREYLDVCTIEKDYAANELTDVRKAKVVECSILRQDILSSKLDDFGTLKYHTQCYLAYISNDKIKRHLKRKTGLDPASTSMSQVPAKTRRFVALFL